MMKDNNEGVAMEMPKYRSHKEVWALKISGIIRESDGTATIIPEDENFAGFKVSKEYMDKHMPKDGGYYVVYEGGYQSWSPADAFEAGNSLIKSNVFNFGMAIEALRVGKKVARTGWNGKGMWLKFVPNRYFDVGMSIVEDKVVGLLPWIGMKTADDKFVPWLASQTDMLADDWSIVP